MEDCPSDNEIFLTQTKMKTNFDLKSDLFSDISSASDTEQELIQATQEAEQKIQKPPINPQFQTLDEEKIEILLKDAASKNTVAKSDWTVRLFEAWKDDRNKKALIDQNVEEIKGELLFMCDKDLDNNLARFITEIHKKDGSEYRGNTLYEIIAGIQYYLREKRRNVNFLDGENFQGLRRHLDAKMKHLARQGIGIQKRKASVTSFEEENKLWSLGILGRNTPQKLLDTLLYTLGLNFALRAGQEHRALRVGPNSQLRLFEGNGSRYIQYTEDVSKTNSGGLGHRKLAPKQTCVYENSEQPDRCPVRIYEQYMSLRPKMGNCEALYLRPLKYTTQYCWYADAPVGVNILSQTVGRMCKEAGFQGFYTNHSLRATAATRLFEAGIDEQLITEKTGHRSSAVRGYKRTSQNQLETVNDFLQSDVKKSRKVEENYTSADKDSIKSSGKEINIQSGDLKICMKF